MQHGPPTRAPPDQTAGAPERLAVPSLTCQRCRPRNEQAARNFAIVGSKDAATTTVSVFGGTGFLGRRLVQRLATEGATVRVAVRHPEQAWSALGGPSRDRVTVHRADVRDQGSVVATVAGADAVVNAVSAYVEKGDVSFEAIHERGAETVAREAR